MPAFTVNDFAKIIQKIAVLETKVHQIGVNVEVNGLKLGSVQNHILLYWMKWSCYPESSQYIMYSEKGTKIIRPMWQLQD